MKLLKFGWLVGLLSLLPLPALANPETCLNKKLQSPSMKIYDEANHLSQVEYNGIRYHWIWLSASKLPGKRFQDVPTVIAENDSGHCAMLLHDPSGMIRSQRDVELLLSKPVSDLFVKEAQRKQKE
ncbi:MAG: hypothetical protein HC851_20975 [Acaryochloris sp. RU_4_1]|nr:hypothetical protein [Acaryochloris sp. RU_4_1]NJR56977.1 hypothetical protein [Acaryochloris sp. CRU_2_0]